MHLEKQANYVPAIGEQFITYWNKSLTYKDFDVKFFTEKSLFTYKYMLATAYYRIVQNDNDHRKSYPDDIVFIADSGGYQMESFSRKGKDVNITPMQVLRWIEKNADIGMNLDVPPWDTFDDPLKRSVENFKLFEKNRINYNFKLYNVLHGKSLSEIQQWYGAVKDFNFDGWAIGIDPATNIYLQIIGYMYLHENDAANLNGFCHFFGMSGLQNMISLAMVSEHFDTALTFDSSSYNIGSRFRKYVLPGNIRYQVDFGRDAKHNLKSIPCNCPVCRNTNISLLYEQVNNITPILISLHNLYYYIETNKFVNSIVCDNDFLLEYALSVNELNLVKNINNMFDDYDKFGVEYVYNKYNNLCMLREPTHVARNLTSIM
jgi:tRNA-guanine family transglycosylase